MALLLGTTLIAIFFSLVFFPVAIKIAEKFNLIDSPDPRSRGEKNRSAKIHLNAVPRIGGAVMISTFLCTMAVTLQAEAFWSLYFYCFLFFAIGFLDDIHPTKATGSTLYSRTLFIWLERSSVD